MKLVRTATATQYDIEVEDLNNILDYDTEAMERCDDTLVEKLDMLPHVLECDYNGHFGHYVFLTIEAEGDTPETWDEIERIITDCVRGHDG